METKDIFKAVRMALGLDQEGIASKLEMKQGSISDIERGRIGLPAKIKKKLVTIGASPTFLESGVGEPLTNTLDKQPLISKPSSSGVHEGEALQFYLKLKQGGIKKFSADMGHSENSRAYMYELFREEKINDITC